MKRTYRFVEPCGQVTCTTDRGEQVEVPVFGGILKHPSADEVAALLTDPVVLRKYTCAALRSAPWSALSRFPRRWLLACLPQAGLPEGRRRAVEFMLGPGG